MVLEFRFRRLPYPLEKYFFQDEPVLPCLAHVQVGNEQDGKLLIPFGVFFFLAPFSRRP